MKRIYAINLRRLFSFCLGASLCLLSISLSANSYEKYDSGVGEVKKSRWLKGTTLDGVEIISLDWKVIEQPDDPMAGDSICFEYTATNLSPTDTLKNVMIIHNAVTIAMGQCLLPNGQMAGSGVNQFTGSGTYMLTGSLCSVLTQQDIDDGFVLQAPVTSFGFTGSLTGPMVSSCVDAIACFGVTLSCTDYNISLDQECETLLTPELLGIKTKVPDSLLRIRIQEDNGLFRPIPMVDNDDVGMKIKVVVDIPGCPDVAPCWSYANIEYKLGPSQICTIDTVSCGAQIAMSDPIITFACGNTEFIRGETIREDLCKTSPDFLAKETITFAVRDEFGNISDTCTQVRYILKPNLKEGDIDWPASDTVLMCGADIFDENGEVLPRFGGVPRWDGADLTDRRIPQLCNVFAEYEDVIELERDCERRIIREWIVNEWKCDGGVTRLRFLQTITLRDTTPPDIEVQASRYELTVNEETCSASFVIPPAMVSDLCQDDDSIEVEIRHPNGTTFGNQETLVSIPKGLNNIVEYIARDKCGNESRDTSFIDVIDITDPVAICLRNTAIAVSDTVVTMGVDKFHQDSYDACGISKKCVVRMDDLELLQQLDVNKDGEVLFSEFDQALMNRANGGDGCYRDYSPSSYVRNGITYISSDSICTSEVKFCCADGGKDIGVVLRVYDMDLNRNECMVMVKVQDKSTATVICLPDITVSCDFEFDPFADLTPFFGNIANNPTMDIPVGVPREFLVDSSGALIWGKVIDNCGASIEELTPEVMRDDICRTGMITRTFRIVDASGAVQTCTQKINIVGDQQNNPLVFEYFPPDLTIVAEDPDDLRRVAIDDPPVVQNTGCSLIGIGYRDQVFALDSIYCTKIFRTWQVIDWCRNPTGLVELERVQTILVTDNDPPQIVLNPPIVVVPQPIAGDAIELFATATDNVVENPKFLKWTYEVYESGQNVPLIADTVPLLDFQASSAVIRLEGLAVAEYEVHWMAMDKCMNTDTVVQSLSVVEREEEMMNVVGQVLFSRGGKMDNVDVYLGEQEEVYSSALKDITDQEGGYAFSNMPMGGSYFIDPEKNDDPLNGVSTLDLILIQRHILGITPLDDPVLQIAADVNGDGSISSLDLVDMRRLLLGHTASFSGKDSWTFVYEGQDLINAMQEKDPLEETYFIQELVQDMDVSFIGIKTGDVSGDVVSNSALADSRSALAAIDWKYELKEFDNEFHLLVRSSRKMNIDGFQGTLEWNGGMALTDIHAGKLTIEKDHYNQDFSDQSLMPVSFNHDQSITIDEDDVLFTLVFAGAYQIEQPDVRMTNELLESELYANEQMYALNLSQEDIAISRLEVAQNVPNPWSETTLIRAEIPLDGQAELRIYDLQNRLIYKEGRQVESGSHLFTVSHEQVKESGLYFYEIEIGGIIARQKMIRVN